MTLTNPRFCLLIIVAAVVVEHIAISSADDSQPKTPDLPTSESKALALAAHTAAAAVDKLPQFYYRALSGNAVVDTMRELDECSLELLKQAIDGPVAERDWLQWGVTLAWNERQALWSNSDNREGGTDDWNKLQHDRVWTANHAFERLGPKGEPAHFNFTPPQQLWRNCLRELAYFRVTPHSFWWATSNYHADAISRVPVEQSSYRFAPRELFDGEMCDVVESPERRNRMWIGRESGRLRGVLTYFSRGMIPKEPFYKTEIVQEMAGRSFATEQEYEQWQRGVSDQQSTELAAAWNKSHFECFKPGELIRFRDYREVAPNVWIPFREDRAFTHSAGAAENRFKYIRLWIAVQDARTDFDLTETIQKLQPKEGEQIQDQRFGVPVKYNFRHDRTQREILELVDAKRQRYISDEALKTIVAPVEELVGKPAPELAAEGWIGGERPGIEGNPCLLHFWATWCGPCKNDLPILKKLASQGVRIIGMHPAGTPAEEVFKVVIDQELGYATLLDSDKAGDDRKVSGYPVVMFPYCVLVDSKGMVAGHGRLGPELMGKFRVLIKGEPESK